LTSPFDGKSPFGQDITHAIAQIALQFDAALDDGPARATGLLELLTQILQELFVLRQPVDDRDRLASTSLFLHSELGHEARWDWLLWRTPGAALAIPLRPAAHRALAGVLGGVNEARVVLQAHDTIISEESRNDLSRTSSNSFNCSFYCCFTACRVRGDDGIVIIMEPTATETARPVREEAADAGERQR